MYHVYICLLTQSMRLNRQKSSAFQNGLHDPGISSSFWYHLSMPHSPNLYNNLEISESSYNSDALGRAVEHST